MLALILTISCLFVCLIDSRNVVLRLRAVNTLDVAVDLRAPILAMAFRRCVWMQVNAVKNTPPVKNKATAAKECFVWTRTLAPSNVASFSSVCGETMIVRSLVAVVTSDVWMMARVRRHAMKSLNVSVTPVRYWTK